MAHTITWTRCPYCKRTASYEVEWGIKTKKRFGKTQYFTCINCKKVFTNGKKEWPEYNDSEKSDLTREFIITGILIAIGIGAILGYFMMQFLNSALFSAIGGLIVALFSGLIIYAIRDTEITESTKRFNQEHEKKDNELNQEPVVQKPVETITKEKNTVVNETKEEISLHEKKISLITNKNKEEIKLIIENELKLSSETFNKIVENLQDKRKLNMIINLYKKNGEYYFFQENENYDLESETRIKDYILEKIKEINIK